MSDASDGLWRLFFRRYGRRNYRRGVVTVTGVTPSASPHDRSVRFTQHDPSAQMTYYEVDLFTVMSLDLQS